MVPSVSRAELRRRLQAPPERHKQTHSVFIGKFRIPAYRDDDVIRALNNDEVLSRRGKKGWVPNGVIVKAVSVPKPGKYDKILGFGPAVTMNWDGISEGRFF